jgi:hypothetical protein
LHPKEKGGQRKLKKMGIYVTRRKKQAMLFILYPFFFFSFVLGSCCCWVPPTDDKNKRVYTDDDTYIFDEEMTVMKHIVTPHDKEQPNSHLEHG